MRLQSTKRATARRMDAPAREMSANLQTGNLVEHRSTIANCSRKGQDSLTSSPDEKVLIGFVRKTTFQRSSCDKYRILSV